MHMNRDYKKYLRILICTRHKKSKCFIINVAWVKVSLSYSIKVSDNTESKLLIYSFLNFNLFSIKSILSFIKFVISKIYVVKVVFFFNAGIIKVEEFPNICSNLGDNCKLGINFFPELVSFNKALSCAGFK